MTRSTRPTDGTAELGEGARSTAASAAAEEKNTTGLTGAPDPAGDTSEFATERDREQRERDDQRDVARGGTGRFRPVDTTAVPPGVRATAAWAWRIVAIAAAGYVLLQVISRVQVVVVPLAIALLLSALLQPLAAVLAKRGMRPGLATAITLVSGLVGLGLLVWLVVDQFIGGFSDLSTQVNEGVDEVQDWLINGPLGLSQTQINEYVTNARASISENRSSLTSGALGAASTAGHVLTGALLTLFATIFFIKDGRQIWNWVVRLFPSGSRERVAGAGERAWRTLISYMHATVAVALVDAVGIGVGAALLGVPLALPLGVLVFLGAFIPIVGATLTGLVAVLVALVAEGPGKALALLIIVLAVQQLEGHVLQPLLLGRAVKVHPLAVVFGIAAGTLLAGIIGALIAVPIVAVISTVGRYLAGGDEPTPPAEPASSGGATSTAPAG